MFRSISKLLGSQTVRKPLVRRPRLPLCLELLEARDVPATLFVDTHPPLLGAFTTITAAVNAAHDGDTIKVAPGTYHEGVDVTKSLTIIGGVPRLPGIEFGPSIIAAGPSSTGFALDANNITIKGFTITQEADAIRTSGEFSGFRILKNTFIDNQFGIHLNTSLAETAATTTISRNKFTFDGDGVAVQDCVLIDNAGARNVVVSNNTFLNNAELDASINVHATNVSTNIQIVSNRFANDAGMVLANVTGAKVDGNSILNPRSTAILLDGGVTTSVVSNNSIVATALVSLLENTAAAQPPGIVLGNETVAALDTGNKIVGNSISGLSVGILLSPANSTKVDHNSVINSTGDGIVVQAGSTGNVVSSNTVGNGGLSGIRVSASSGNTISQNTASHQDSGIFLSAATQNTLTGNTAQFNRVDGITLSTGSTFNTLTGNTASFNPTGVRLEASGSNTLTGNVANQNLLDGFFLGNGSQSNTLTGNTARGNFQNGFDASLGDVANNDFNKNVAIHNLLDGFFIEGNDNFLTNNTASRNGLDGFEVFEGVSNVLRANTANDNGREGMFLEHQELATISGNTASGNGGDGMFFVESDNNSVTGNTVQDNAGNGIKVDAASSGNTITFNTATGNGEGGAGFDLLDLSLSTTNNTWANNRANTRQPFGLG